MKIHYKNKHLLNKINTHDGIFNGLHYDVENHTLSFQLFNCCRDAFPGQPPSKRFVFDRNYLFTCTDVFGFEMTHFEPWGGSAHDVYDMGTGDWYGNPVTRKLLAENEKYGAAHSRLLDEEKIIELALQLISGDLLLIACGCIEIMEQSAEGAAVDFVIDHDAEENGAER